MSGKSYHFLSCQTTQTVTVPTVTTIFKKGGMVYTPRIMKNLKRALPVAMAVVLGSTAAPLVVKADTSKVVTIGANLSDSQKQSMYEYFGTSSDKVENIEVTNADERKYLEGVAPDSQIGTRTYSCSYVEPTTSGGIQVKVSNLTYVTSSMISSTLLTSGVENCNVVAASPIEVSGTGALTGIMMAYEKASGTKLSEDQKETANQELVTTSDLADSVGQEKATDVMNDAKQSVIKDKLTDSDDIQNAVKDAAKNNNVTLTDEQLAKITQLMESISQYDYDVKALKSTLDNIDGKSGGFFSNLWNSIKGVFGGSDSSDGGIINDTDDSALGDNVVSNSTLDSDNSSDNSSDSNASDSSDNSDDTGFFGKIKKFFQDLFGGSSKDDSTENTDSNSKNDDADTEDSNASDTTESSDTANTEDQTLNGDASATEDTTSETYQDQNDASSESSGSDQSTSEDNSTSGSSNTDSNSSENTDSTTAN